MFSAMGTEARLAISSGAEHLQEVVWVLGERRIGTMDSNG